MTERRLYVRYRSATSRTGIACAIVFSDSAGNFPRMDGVLFKAEIKPEYFGKSLGEIDDFFRNPKPRVGVRHD